MEEYIMTVTADWIMVNDKDGDTWYGTKERKQGERLMRVHELQEMANDDIELGLQDHPSRQHLFNDFLVVQQGVFQWNEKSKSFRKVSDKYDEISEPIPW
jgi:hypothetical protein